MPQHTSRTKLRSTTQRGIAGPPYPVGIVQLKLKGRRAVVVSAHPDDETAGAAGCLPWLPAPVFVHVTDGAPRDMRDAAANGFATREAYAAARRLEFRDALETGGIRPRDAIAIGCVDQEAPLHLIELTRELACILKRLLPEVVLVHPYEGGHPDHDATAFAVHAARSQMGSSGPEIVEFTSYHQRDGRMQTGAFLPPEAKPAKRVRLDSEARGRKERMLACYRTQQQTLRLFGTTEERFRAAPRYAFTSPPHQGTLLYEQFAWGMTRERWTELAAAAIDGLGLC